MSFREHIRILKSDNHISIPLVEKIQDFLTEGALTPAEITKYDWRIDLFIDKFID